MDEWKMEMIQHPIHEHPLVWRQLANRYPINHRCNVCHSFILTIHYACLKCKYYVHVFCVAPFLRDINHPSHPHHSLTLNDEPGILYVCAICRGWKDCSFYSCHFGCEFRMDIYCALRTPTAICEKKEKGQGKPFCHKQPMEDVEVDKYAADGVVMKCYICELPLSSSSQKAFTCKICKCFFHKSCTDQLSPKIRHPLHLRHFLVIQLGRHDEDKTKCHLCGKIGFNFTYSCSLCDFYMCIVCFLVTPSLRTIAYQGHDHLLYLGDDISNNDENVKCCSASYTCWKQLVIASDEHNLTDRYRFFCEICDFSLHLLCGPLPHSIKHNCHVHPRTLFDSIVEDNSGEYYCDACEAERNPRICVYYCGDCKFIAHLHCVISEVICVLSGDCRDVDLRIVGQRKFVIDMDHHNDIKPENEKANIIEVLKEEKEKEKEFRPTILLDIIISIAKDLHIREESMNLEEEQKEELKEIERYDQAKEVKEKWKYSVAFHTMNSLIEKKQDVVHQRSKSIEGKEQEQQIEESIQDSFTYQSFEQLVHKLNNFDYPARWNKVASKDLMLKLVNVGPFMVPWNLADVLKYILVKYGDISDENTSDSKWKSLIFYLLCRLLYSMSKIMVEDVTEDLLGDWYSCLRFVKYEGFKVGFVNVGLERVVRAYIGLQKSRAEIAFEMKMDKNILRLQEEIAKLEAKLKRCMEDRQMYQRYKTSKRHGSYETINYSMEECSDEASNIKWKYVADCLV